MLVKPLRRIMLAALLALGALSVNEAPAQISGVVRGRIAGSDDGQPIAGAVVRLPQLGRETSSDSDGGYAFQAVPYGDHEVVVEAVGRVAAHGRVKVTAGREASLDLALDPAVIRVPEIRVVVDGRRIVGDRERASRIPGAADVLGPAELARQKGLYDDVHRILRQVPGVVLVEEDGYGLRSNIGLRGTGSDRSSKITLMEDGVLIAPAPYAAPAAYYFPVAGRMEAIEVRKGSSQIKYGPLTIGGALNLVSSSIPEELSAVVNLEGAAGETGKARLKLGDRTDHFGWLVETYQIRSDGFKQLDGGGDTGFWIQDYMVKLAVHSGPEAARFQELELKLGHTTETSNETYLGLTERDFRAAPFRRYAASQKDVMEADHDQVQLRWTVHPSDRLDVTTVVYDNRFHRNWYKLDRVLGRGIADVLEDPEAFPEALAILQGSTSAADALVVRANNRGYDARGVQSTLGLRLDRLGQHAIEIGIRYHADQEDRFQHDDRYRMESGRMVLTRTGAPGSQSNRVSDARAWALYLQHEIAFGRWILTPGVRWETIDFTRTDYAASDQDRTGPPQVLENRVDAVIPGLGAVYRWSEGVHLFAGVHRGFGPPGPGAHQDTRPEESVNYELGVKLRRDVIEVRLVGFTSDYDNILGRATLAVGDATGAGELFNGGAARVTGLELGLDLDPAAALDRAFRVPVRVAYTLTDAEFMTSFESEFEPWGRVERGDELPYMPEHQLYASAGLEHGRWAARLHLSHVSAMRTEAGRGPIPAGRGTDAFTVWNASAEFAAASWSSVFAGVENLTDRVYAVARRPAGARPGLPRTILLGIRLRT